MYRFCLLLLLSSTSLIAAAQTKYEIGVEGSATNCTYRLTDAGRNLKAGPALSGMGGINFRINTKKRFYYEAALMATEYAEGVNFRQLDGFGYSNSDEALLLALRVGYYVRLSSKLSIVPVVGVVPGYVTFSQDGGFSALSASSNGNSYNYEYTARDLNRRMMLLLQGGVGLDFKIARRVRLMISPSYYAGLRTTKVFDIRYTINNGPVQTATMYGKGSMWSYGLSLGYLFGK